MRPIRAWTSRPRSPNSASARRWSACSTPRGRPCPTERVYVLPPGSQIGPITPQQRQALIAGSLVAGHYERRSTASRPTKAARARGEFDDRGPRRIKPGRRGDARHPRRRRRAGSSGARGGGLMDGLKDVLFGSTGPRGGAATRAWPSRRHARRCAASARRSDAKSCAVSSVRCSAGRGGASRHLGLQFRIGARRGQPGNEAEHHADLGRTGAEACSWRPVPRLCRRRQRLRLPCSPMPGSPDRRSRSTPPTCSR